MNKLLCNVPILARQHLANVKQLENTFSIINLLSAMSVVCSMYE